MSALEIAPQPEGESAGRKPATPSETAVFSGILLDLLYAITWAQSLTDVRVAAGIAYESLEQLI